MIVAHIQDMLYHLYHVWLLRCVWVGREVEKRKKKKKYSRFDVLFGIKRKREV